MIASRSGPGGRYSLRPAEDDHTLPESEANCSIKSSTAIIGAIDLILILVMIYSSITASRKLRSYSTARTSLNQKGEVAEERGRIIMTNNTGFRTSSQEKIVAINYVTRQNKSINEAISELT